jgi:hypothetical protein
MKENSCRPLTHSILYEMNVEIPKAFRQVERAAKWELNDESQSEFFWRYDVVDVLWYEQLKINYIYIHYNA